VMDVPNIRAELGDVEQRLERLSRMVADIADVVAPEE
jgi:hypothetical protein